MPGEEKKIHLFHSFELNWIVRTCSRLIMSMALSFIITEICTRNFFFHMVVVVHWFALIYTESYRSTSSSGSDLLIMFKIFMKPVETEKNVLNVLQQRESSVKWPSG